MEKSQLEARINSLISARAGEKQTVSSLEKKLAEEKKTRTDFQIKLEAERKNKKEAVKAELNAAQQSVNSACVQKLEVEVSKLKDELARTEQRANSAEEEIMGLRKNKKEAVKAELTAAQQSVNSACVQKLEVEVSKLKDELARTEQRANTAEEEIMGLRKNSDNDKLVLQLKKLKESEEKLSDTLSSETKIKMDLFSALGVAKRDLQIREHMLMEKDREILDLKGTVTEFLAVGSSNSINNIMSSLGVGAAAAAPLNAAPGGFPATTRTTSASSGLFTPYNHGGELGVLDLPAGTELSRLAGLGLDSLDSGVAVTR